ncbi:MAG: hypothetical protein QOG03_619 [Actinomycetota bacterium]|jgi:hypothetical protein|nr:hypothetical protein [Actinomycetota bacterium]
MRTRTGASAVAALLTVALLASGPARSADTRRKATPAVHGPSLVAVKVANQSDAARLASAGFDLAEARTADAIKMVAWPGDAARLTAMGFHFTTLIADLDTEGRDAGVGAAPVAASATTGGPNQGDYRHLADYDRELRDLAATYPDHVRLFTAPLQTAEGRTVTGVEIAKDVNATDGRPVSFIMGLHHAREWPSGEVTMDFANELARSFGTDPRITADLTATRVLVVPVVNPDGFNWSREYPVELSQDYESVVAGGEGAYWRKNRRGPGTGTVPMSPLAYGVDPNRNYGYHWGSGTLCCMDYTSANPTDQTYQGDAAFSEAESENIRQIVLRHQVMTLITNHTFSNLVLWPWGDTQLKPPDIAAIKNLGNKMAAVNGYTPQQGINLYPTTGSTEDWAYAAEGTFGYTFEHGTSFHPTYTSTFPAMYQHNRGAFLLAIEAAADTTLHGVINGTVRDSAGSPVSATLELTRTGQMALDQPTGAMLTDTVDTIMTAAADGRFTWHVNPSTRPVANGPETYQLTVSAPGHGPVVTSVLIKRGQTVDLGTINLG